jgi:hypothetical protein
MNTNLINDVVLPDSMVTFRNNSVITNALKPHYDSTYEAFGAKAGQTINLRTHQEFSVREDTLNIDVQDVEQKSTALTRSKIFGVDIKYSDAELTQDVDGFMEYRVAPAMATLAAKVDSYVYETISDGINRNFVGLSGRVCRYAGWRPFTLAMGYSRFLRLLLPTRHGSTRNNRPMGGG